MTIIEQNPYRILGVLTNSSTKEITANYGKIKAFSKTGNSSFKAGCLIQIPKASFNVNWIISDSFYFGS